MYAYKCYVNYLINKVILVEFPLGGGEGELRGTVILFHSPSDCRGSDIGDDFITMLLMKHFIHAKLCRAEITTVGKMRAHYLVSLSLHRCHKYEYRSNVFPSYRTHMLAALIVVLYLCCFNIRVLERYLYLMIYSVILYTLTNFLLLNHSS